MGPYHQLRHSRHHPRLSTSALPSACYLSPVLSWSRTRAGRPSTREGGDGVDFVAVVDQAIALLRQRDRLTYRTLQLQFQLNDVHLTALKEEFIEGQRLAVDEAGRVLVWIGASGATASPAAPSSLEPLPQAPLAYTP